MWQHYWLEPTVPAERDKVLLLMHVASDERDRLDLRLYIAGAQTLGSMPGLSPDGIRRVMHAGASWNRFEGVRLSNGFNVIDPEDWRGQGIGTLAFNRMIAWAKQHHAGADVRPIALLRDGQTIAADDRRLGFYRRFGLQWHAEDQRLDDPEWRSRSISVDQLHEAPLPDRLQRLTPAWTISA